MCVQAGVSDAPTREEMSMKFYVGVTDNDWYRFVAELHPDELNFWRPTSRSFGAIKEGSPFLFKLHSPLNYIVGGGFFVRHSVLPIYLAWEAFETKNGAPDLPTLYQNIQKYRGARAGTETDPHIGCTILTSPFFFGEEDWIPVPGDWGSGIRQGKTYDTREPNGAALWGQVQQRLARQREASDQAVDGRLIAAEERERYGAEYPRRPRLGQGAFRVLVTEAYQRRCAVTGDRTLPVLQAAHIKPYGESGPHRVDNGLLVRADFHILLERGYMTLTEAMQIEVSRRIREDFDNGEEYYALHGKNLEVVPALAIDQPSAEFISWHNENRFLG
jgi:putative restriction endonuclease